MKRRLVILALFLLISTTCAAMIPIQPIKVEGTAMEPALKDGDRITIDKKLEKLDRGDIVVFLHPHDPVKSYISRIIGLPNDTVEIREGKVIINGTLLDDEPYVDPKNNQSARNLPEVKLAEDAYFVMGDNRDNSSDSRLWGPVQRKFIYGKYVKKYLSVK